MGLLRLRKVAGPAALRQPQLQGRVSIVRELHVYGTAVAVHARDSSKFQHQVPVTSPPSRSSHFFFLALFLTPCWSEVAPCK